MQLKPHILIISAVALLGMGIFIGWLMTDSPTEIIDKKQMDKLATREIWTCSMHPQIQQSEPGSCPLCGMDLIPLANSENSDDPLAIYMSEDAMKLANVQTSIVGSIENQKVIMLNGIVAVNEKLQRAQAAHVSGRVEELYINFTGEFIEAGQPLASIYAPELVNAQKELMIANDARQEQPELFESAKQKLRLWKLTDQQIDDILSSGKIHESLPLLANTSGYVLKKSVNVGDYVKSGQSLYTVVELKTVWLMFDIYESQIEAVKKGDRATVSLTAIPGTTFEAKIDYIDPIIDPVTRVAKARIELNNPNNQLKPGMFAKAVLMGSATEDVKISVPKSAVMWTGKRSIVYVKTGGENGIDFRLREVLLGQALGDRYLIKEGLLIGEEIAAYGTFSIDAAAQLEGKPSMMNPEGGVAPTGHNHGGGIPNSEDVESKVDHSKMDHSQVQPYTSSAEKSENLNYQANEPPKELVDLLDTYFLLKISLTKTDMNSAKKYAVEFERKLAKIDMSVFSGSAHKIWMEVNEIIKAESAKMASAEKMRLMREAFKPLSASLVQLASEYGGYESPIYVQFCPMADRNKGGFWMSRNEQIINPYFGQSMLSCGTTKNQL